MDSVILAPKYDDCTLINSGELRTYHSYDKTICDNGNDINNYPVEILNSLTISGLPPHKLVLKINCIVLLIRNLNTKEALVNGTRMCIKFMHRNAINCKVWTGTVRNKRILIPRKNLTYSGTILPYNLQRTPFPIIPAFAMTISLKEKHLKKLEYFWIGQIYSSSIVCRSK